MVVLVCIVDGVSGESCQGPWRTKIGNFGSRPFPTPVDNGTTCAVTEVTLRASSDSPTRSVANMEPITMAKKKTAKKAAKKAAKKTAKKSK
jgi:hypothetical protein